MIRAVATKSERASGTSTNPVTSKGSSSIQTARRTWVEYRDQTGLALGNLGTFILMISCDAGRERPTRLRSGGPGSFTSTAATAAYAVVRGSLGSTTFWG